jgi:hypothetical protein
LELFDQMLFKVFVPVLFEVSVCAVEAAGPLLLVKVNFVGLVDEVGREQKYPKELSELGQEPRVAVGSRHRFN